uniref:Uncharacterized protein n=1 Tax=Pyxicephalus adspersus TaxID=30357 RepID=A0AAV2ZVG8_PYXAD|nr:TPA: hypothetical protein GDO54_016498 [Pyxicephalus adspersus]
MENVFNTMATITMKSQLSSLLVYVKLCMATKCCTLFPYTVYAKEDSCILLRLNGYDVGKCKIIIGEKDSLQFLVALNSLLSFSSLLHIYIYYALFPCVVKQRLFLEGITNGEKVPWTNTMHE